MTCNTHRLLRAGLTVTIAAALVATGSVVALATDGDQVARLFQSSYAHEAEGRPKQALADMQAVLQQDGGHYVATLRAGWLSYRAGQHLEAATFYREAVKLAPKAVEPRLGLMLPLMALSRWRAAEQAGDAVVKRDPRNYSARSRLAFIYFSQGRFAKAGAAYAAVLDDYPSDLDMELGMGWTLARQGRSTQAARRFRRVLRLQPANASARQGLAALDAPIARRR